MKKRLVLVGLMLALVMTGSAACKSGNSATSQQSIKVVSGNLTIKVSGSGNIEPTHEKNLTFGTSGRIASLTVKEGDEAKEGQVLAKLETDALELSLAQANLSYAQAQLSVNQSAQNVNQAQLGVAQAEITLTGARIARDQAVTATTVSDVKIAQAQLDTAKSNLKDTISMLSYATPGTQLYLDFEQYVVLAQAAVQGAQSRLDAMLNGYSSDEIALKDQQVAVAQEALTNARQSLALAKLSGDVAGQSVVFAGISRDYTQKQIDKATLTAPFSGVIDSLPVHEGDTILPSSLIAHLVEPGNMELQVQIDEIDIPSVKVGQKAIVKVDALPNIYILGTVTSITPIPVKDAGVTLYYVKVGIDSSNISGLRVGMSANADIVINERDNVLLVPDRAVKQNAQGQTVVNVVDGKTQERVVVTGISDGFQTEIISGLKEGETVTQ